MEEEKKNAVRVRTSITIDEATLEHVKLTVGNPNLSFKSVSQFIEQAVQARLKEFK